MGRGGRVGGGMAKLKPDKNTFLSHFSVSVSFDLNSLLPHQLILLFFGLIFESYTVPTLIALYIIHLYMWARICI